MGLTGKVAIVTGAGRGIGRAIAVHLAAEGAAVGVLDVNGKCAADVAAEIAAGGGISIPVTADVTDQGLVAAAFTSVRERLGSIGVLVNNAGWDRFGPFQENEPELWDRLIDINFRGALLCTREALADMRPAKWGRIVAISSDAARVGSSGEAVYAGCKAALIAFSKTIAREVARFGVTVNVVCPGPTETPLLAEIMAGERGAKVMEAVRRSIPIGRFGKPDDIPPAVAFFASRDAAFITGQVLSVSGGLTMVG